MTTLLNNNMSNEDPENSHVKDWYYGDEKYYNFAENVDIFSLEPAPNPKDLVSLAIEHGFRGIEVLHPRIEALCKQLKKIPDSNKVVPISIVDYPFGCSSLDVRNYSVMSAKEKGAKEVEIVIPYHFLADKDFRSLEDDIRNIKGNSIKNDIKIRYIVDLNSHFFTENVITRLSRIFSNYLVDVNTSSGWFDKRINHSDNILKIRALKNKSNIKIKSYIHDCDIETLVIYNKANIDIIGLYWKIAPGLVHAFEEKVS